MLNHSPPISSNQCRQFVLRVARRCGANVQITRRNRSARIPTEQIRDRVPIAHRLRSGCCWPQTISRQHGRVIVEAVMGEIRGQRGYRRNWSVRQRRVIGVTVGQPAIVMDMVQVQQVRCVEQGTGGGGEVVCRRRIVVVVGHELHRWRDRGEERLISQHSRCGRYIADGHC